MPSGQISLIIRTAMNRCLVMLLGLAFCCGQYVSLVGNGTEAALPHSGSFIVSANHFSHTPFRSGFVYEPMAEEETCSETNEGDEFIFSWGELFSTLSFETIFDFTPVSTLFHQLEESIQNRFTASLFVLHHAWKDALI